MVKRRELSEFRAAVRGEEGNKREIKRYCFVSMTIDSLAV
jgi:hypothetical protein